MSASTPTCPYGKIGFAHQRAALRSGARMRRDVGKTAPAFSYECGACGQWHLTQQSPQTRRKRSKRAAQALAHRKEET